MPSRRGRVFAARGHARHAFVAARARGGQPARGRRPAPYARHSAFFLLVALPLVAVIATAILVSDGRPRADAGHDVLARARAVAPRLRRSARLTRYPEGMGRPGRRGTQLAASQPDAPVRQLRDDPSTHGRGRPCPRDRPSDMAWRGIASGPMVWRLLHRLRGPARESPLNSLRCPGSRASRRRTAPSTGTGWRR